MTSNILPDPTRVAIFPKPRPDRLSLPFWDMARQGVLGLQRCTTCGALHFPASPVCPECLSDRQEWIASSGRGTLYSWCRFHKPYWDSVAPAMPYLVAMVRLDEGPVLITRLVGVSDRAVLQALRLDLPVQVRFETADDGEFSLPVFALGTQALEAE